MPNAAKGAARKIVWSEAQAFSMTCIRPYLFLPADLINEKSTNKTGKLFTVKTENSHFYF
jgi:hypothetical protein